MKSQKEVWIPGKTVALGRFAGCCLVFAFSLLLVACEAPSSGRTPQPKPVNFTVKPGFESGVSCGCPTARQYYLHNLTEELRSVSFTEYRNDLFNPNVEVHEREVDVPGKGREFLACSPQTVSKPCDTVYSWKIEGQLFQTDRLYKTSNIPGNKTFAAGDFLLKQLEAPAMMENTSLSCREECLENNSARCMLLDVSSGGDASAGRAFLAAIGTLSDDDRLTRERVLGFYGQDEDPCDRSDIVVNNGVLSNTGAACDISSSWGGSQGGVTIGIPSAMVGKLNTSDSGFHLQFRNALAAPSLELEDRYLNPVFGGTIRYIEKVDSHLLVQTGEACLGLKVQ